jgi:hypothetical protein
MPKNQNTQTPTENVVELVEETPEETETVTVRSRINRRKAAIIGGIVAAGAVVGTLIVTASKRASDAGFPDDSEESDELVFDTEDPLDA